MGASRKVLLVDDEDAVRRSLERLLVLSGHTVSHAASVAGALAVLDGHDVAVVDLLLPDGRGAEVIGAIRVQGRPIRTALLTGKPEADASERADVMFFKPLDVDALMRWVGEGQ